MGRLARFIRFYTDEDDGNGGEKGVLKTVTGALLHIVDALAKPAKKFTATLEPIQDLHGQDTPYPSGGGKNLIDFIVREQFGVTAEKVDGKAYIHGTNTGSGSSFPVDFKVVTLQAGTYVWSISGVTTGITTAFTINGAWGGTISQGATLVLDEETEVGGYIAVASGATVNTTVAFQLESGSTSTGWSPYENICPITGHTGANVYDTGVNVWDEVWELGTYSLTDGTPVSSNYSIRGKNRISVKANTSYYCNNSYLRVLFYDANDNFISYVTGSGVKTTPSNCKYIRLYLADTYGVTYHNDVTINYPSTDTDYHAYSGQTIPITFPDAAGTVYGGTLINEGTKTWKLSANMASVDMGTLTWGVGAESDKPFFLTESLKDVIKQIPNNTTKAAIKTPIYITTSYWGGNPVSFMNTDFDITQTSGSHQIRTRDSRYSTAQEYKTAMSGVQLVYELATPIDYILTESQALTLLKGTNNVWCDASDDLEMQYYAKAEETTP